MPWKESGAVRDQLPEHIMIRNRQEPGMNVKTSPLIGPTLSILRPSVCSRSAMRRITYGEPFSEVAAADLPPGKFYTERRSDRLLSAHLLPRKLKEVILP